MNKMHSVMHYLQKIQISDGKNKVIYYYSITLYFLIDIECNFVESTVDSRKIFDLQRLCI